MTGPRLASLALRVLSFSAAILFAGTGCRCARGGARQDPSVQTSAPARAEPIDLGFEAGFRAAQARHVLGTPIAVELRYRNVGRFPLEVRGWPFRSECDARPPVRRLSPFGMGGISSRQVTAPQTEGAYKMLLNQYLTFPGPGHYVVQCRWEAAVNVAGSDAEGASRRYPILTDIELDIVDDRAGREAIYAKLEERLLGPDGDAAGETASLVSNMYEERLVPLMAKALAKEPERVGFWMILGLAHVENDEARAALRAFLQTEASPALRKQAGDELRGMEERRAPH